MPSGNVEPEAGLQLTEPTPEQLSDTVGAGYETGIGELEIATALLGQVMVGFWLSLTVTVKVQD